MIRSMLRSLCSLLFCACCSLGSAQVVVVNGYNWVLATSSTSHAEACFWNGMKPTPQTDQIPWSTAIMENVTTALGKTVISQPHGVRGCCVPALFCNTDTCFTQALGPSFFNYQSIHEISSYTVYTCQGIPPDDTRLALTTTDLNQGVASLSAVYHGADDTDIDATVAGKPCSDVEVCSGVCNSCSRLSHNCSKDSVCLSVSNVFSCYMYCSGPKDTSCPCGTSCQSVKVYIGNNQFLSTNFCGPKDLSCPSYRDELHINCRSPRSYRWTADSPSAGTAQKLDLNVSLRVGADGDITTIPHTTNVCSNDGQCFDKDMYSSDTCALGECNYTFAHGNNIDAGRGSTFPAIRDRNTHFTYIGFVSSNMDSELGIFESKVRLAGKLSKVSNVDDSPVEAHKLPFVFRFFGNDVQDLHINPNGLISLPPFTECIAMAGSLRCPVYATDTNVISIWGSDWDPTLQKGSTVHFMFQNKSNDFDDMYGINANAFHVLYSQVYKFVSGKARNNPTNPATYSLSIYDDGSIRIRYHEVDASHEAPDVYGLWGSVASERNLPGTRYHEEAIDVYYVKSETDVTYCAIDTVACASETVVFAGGEVSVRVLGNQPSCTALGEPLQLTCVWAGGSSGDFLTTPVYFPDTSPRRTILRCPVPTMSFANDTLISLDVLFGSNMSSLMTPSSAGESGYTGKYWDMVTGELVTSHLMFRYFSSESAAAGKSYGCNAVSGPSSTSPDEVLSCDVCLVCGGNGTAVDCNGECFGVAFVDNCGVCAGGSSGIYPDSSCNLQDGVKNWEETNMLDTISKTILLLTMMICMTFVFSACMRVVRASFTMGQDHRHVDGGLMGMIPHHPLRRGNGLTRFEIDALGQFEYSSSSGGKNLDGVDIEHATSSPLVIDFSAAECAICLNDLSDGDICRQLPCDHLFHVDCIDQWFTLSVACPMCKRNIRAIIVGDAEELPRTSLSRPRAPTGDAPVSSASTGSLAGDRTPDSELVESPLIELTAISRNGGSSDRSSGTGSSGENRTSGSHQLVNSTITDRQDL